MEYHWYTIYMDCFLDLACLHYGSSISCKIIPQSVKNSSMVSVTFHLNNVLNLYPFEGNLVCCVGLNFET